MDLFINTFGAVATLLGIGFVGFWIIRQRVVPESAVEILSPLALEIGLPCLIFSKIILHFDPGSCPDWWRLPLWWALFTALAAILTLVARHLAQKRIRREFSISLFYHNGIFVPLAVISGLYPDKSPYLVDLFLFTMFFPAFMFNTYHLFFNRTTEGLDWKKIMNPVFIATLFAIFIKLFDLHDYIPDFVLSVCSMLGNIALPVIMLILGANLYIDFKKRGLIFRGEIIKFLVLKNLVFPLIFLGALLLIRPNYSVALIIILSSAVPPLSATPIFAQRAGGNPSIANQLIVSSFLFSLLTIPLVVMLFGLFFKPIDIVTLY